MPRNISKYGRPLPYFMKYRSPYYARQELGRTPSNMNRLCWDIEHWERGLKFKRNTGFDYRIMIDESVNTPEETVDRLERLFMDFCKESSAMSRYQSVVRKYEQADIRSKFTREEAAEYMADWEGLYEKYKTAAVSICPDERVLANAAVKICYERHKNKGMKFPWVIAPNGIVSNIQFPEHNYLPEQNEEGDILYLGKRYIASEDTAHGISADEYSDLEVKEWE